MVQMLVHNLTMTNFRHLTISINTLIGLLILHLDQFSIGDREDEAENDLQQNVHLLLINN